MSLLNFRADPDRLIVAFDTAADLSVVAGSRVRGEASKCWHIAHANCVVAVRGNSHILPALGYTLGLTTCRSFDEVSTFIAAGTLDQLVPALLGTYAASGGVRDDCWWQHSEDECFLGGWSDRNGRMVGQKFIRAPGSQEFAVGPLMRYGFSPGDPFVNIDEAGAGALFCSDQALTQAAQQQVAWAKINCPGAAIGGRLLCFELTRRGAAFRDLGAFL